MAEDDTTRIIRRNVSGGDETRPIGSGSTSFESNQDDPHTRIFRPKSAAVTTSSGIPVPEKETSDFSTDPVVGWLVVTDGPGRGNFHKLGYGVNTIGRGPESRVSLDYGDEEISRQGHAMLTYDTKSRKFFVQHGNAVNLTYLGDAPVLQPHEITGREVIGLGSTRLMFVPFCGPEFEWQG
jgi:hypothetical protein